MILLDDVVEVFHLQDLYEWPKAKGPQQKVQVQQTSLVGTILVDHHLLGHAIITDGLLEKRLGCSFVPLLGEHEIRG
jgi:hypothetical protein